MIKKREYFPLLITLPVVTPSNNTLLRMHYRKRMRLKVDYELLLLAAGANAPELKAEKFEKRTLEIISHRRQLADQDNITGGMKILIDAIRDLELIYDDGPRFLEIKGIQQVPDINQFTLIKIGLVEEKNEEEEKESIQVERENPKHEELDFKKTD